MSRTLLPRNALSASSPATKAGLITLIVVVSTVFTTVIFLLILKQWKIRQYETLPQRSSYMTGAAELSVKSRNASQEDAEEHQELQRQFMIRKSLASRTTSRTESRVENETRKVLRSSSDYDSGDDNLRPASLMSDWKEFEANVQREPSASLESHPSLQNLKHPLARQDSVYGRRVSSPALSDRSSTLPLRPSCLQNAVTAPPPAASVTPLSHSRLVRSTIQVPPPRRATIDQTKTAQPRRATFDSAKSMPRRGTFDTVPEESISVPLAEKHVEKRGYNWI